MPTYLYECPRCHKTIEQHRPVADRDTPSWCFWCEEEAPRVPSAPAFHLKGAGFYVNDYKNKKD